MNRKGGWKPAGWDSSFWLTQRNLALPNVFFQAAKDPFEGISNLFKCATKLL